MNKITLQTPIGNSEIIIGENILKNVNEWTHKNHPSAKQIIITDSDIAEIYSDELKSNFPDTEIITVPAGEETKTIESVKQLCSQLLKLNFTRSDLIIAIGGGMITDLAGFVASVYMRGLNLILIPTSLLCIVDAAVGGKTSINLIAKNTLGTFYPAKLVCADTMFLKKLPERQFNTGMAEVIKYSATIDSSLFDELMKDQPDMKSVIQKSIQAKVKIVAQDVMESGLRKVFNYGHTFGHAVEQISNYKLTHGEAISIGMVLSNRIAQKLGKQSVATGAQIKKLLEKFNLPTEIPPNIKKDTLVSLIKKDKKMSGNHVTFIIAPEIGKYEMIEMKPEKLIKFVK